MDYKDRQQPVRPRKLSSASWRVMAGSCSVDTVSCRYFAYDRTMGSLLDLTALAHLVGDPSRLKMLVALSAKGELTAGELAAAAGVTPQTACPPRQVAAGWPDKARLQCFKCIRVQKPGLSLDGS
jgi:hypothetical protein